jgi:uncharacterized protein (TIRG00374 family)
MNKRNMKTTILFVLRWGIALALFVALFWFKLLDWHILSQAFSRPLPLLLAVFVLVLTLPIAGLRWYILLRTQNFTLPLRQAIQIVSAGAFFNTFLPGAFGGDLVRGVYIVKLAEKRRTIAVLSLLIDRILGLAGLLLLGVAVACLRPSGILGLSSLSIIFLAGGMLIALLAILVLGHWVSGIAQKLLGSKAKPIIGILEQVQSGLSLYTRYWPQILLCLLFSILIYALAVGGLLVIADATPMGNLSLFDEAIAGVYALFLNSVPFTPGGLGIGEGAYAKICAALEPIKSGAPYATIFLIYRCATILATLPGLLAFLTYKASSQQSAKVTPVE